VVHEVLKVHNAYILRAQEFLISFLDCLTLEDEGDMVFETSDSTHPAALPDIPDGLNPQQHRW
jgi:hypothetical protein